MSEGGRAPRGLDRRDAPSKRADRKSLLDPGDPGGEGQGRTSECGADPPGLTHRRPPAHGPGESEGSGLSVKRGPLEGGGGPDVEVGAPLVAGSLDVPLNERGASGGLLGTRAGGARLAKGPARQTRLGRTPLPR